jgi:hypothetical protein
MVLDALANRCHVESLGTDDAAEGHCHVALPSWPTRGSLTALI